MSRAAAQMTCDRFERWLDAGAPQGGEPDAAAHAAGCARCRDAWDAARAVHALLVAEAHAAPATVAPAGFADAVMLRVASAARPAWPVALEDPMPWWVRATMHPTVAMAAVLTGILVWTWNDLLALAQRAGLGVAAWTGSDAAQLVTGTLVAVGTAFGRVASVWSARDTLVHVGLALALVPAMFWLASRLAGWSEQLGSAMVRREPTVH